jgi:hypothetical protein
MAQVLSEEAFDGCNGADATAYGGSGMGGIQGLPVSASRRAVSAFWPCLAAVEM